MIEKKMELAGIRSLRAYLLKMAVNGYVVQLDLSGVREMVSLLRIATSNLNQIARRTNETSNLYAAVVEDLHGHYDRLFGNKQTVPCLSCPNYKSMVGINKI